MSHQLEDILREIQIASQQSKYRAPVRPWLEPLPEILPATLLKDYIQEEKVMIGLVDDPSRQQQYGLSIDPEQHGNVVIIGASGTGKSSALQTMAQALQSQGYLCLVSEIRDEMMFDDVLRQLQESVGIRPTVLLIDDFEQFRERFEYSLTGNARYQQLLELIASGRQQRCSIVVTMSREGGLNGQLVPYFRQWLYLGRQHPEQPKSVTNHFWQSLTLEHSQGHIPGRGWVQRGGFLEFQLVAPVDTAKPETIRKDVTEP